MKTTHGVSHFFSFSVYIMYVCTWGMYVHMCVLDRGHGSTWVVIWVCMHMYVIICRGQGSTWGVFPTFETSSLLNSAL